MPYPEYVKRSVPSKDAVISFNEIVDGIEISRYCTFEDIAEFIMEQAAEKMYVNGKRIYKTLRQSSVTPPKGKDK